MRTNKADSRIGLCLVVRRFGGYNELSRGTGISNRSLSHYGLGRQSAYCNLNDGNISRGWENIKVIIENAFRKAGATPEEIDCLWIPYTEAHKRLIGSDETSESMYRADIADNIFNYIKGVTMLSPESIKYWKFNDDPFHKVEIDLFEDFWSFEYYLEIVSEIRRTAERGGMLALTGPVGSGKTTCTDRAIVELEESGGIEIIQPTLPDSKRITGVSILDSILDAISANYGFDDDQTKPPGGEHKSHVAYGAMRRVLSEGKRCALIVDESQRLTIDAFKSLKRLWEMKYRSGRVQKQMLSVILVGQEELSERLRGHGIREVNIRLNAQKLSTIPPLQAMDYLRFKMRRVNGDWDRICTPELQEELSLGISEEKLTPMSLNVLAASLLDYGRKLAAERLTLELYWELLKYKGASTAQIAVWQTHNKRRNQSIKSDNSESKIA